MPTIDCTITADGAIRIAYGDIAIADGYPAIDGIPVRPRSFAIDADGTEATWLLADGASLRLQRTVLADGCQLELRLSGFTRAPKRVALFQDATLRAARAFRLAHGIGGGSRWCELPATTEEESSSLVGLVSASGAALALWSADCRRFDSRLRWRAGRGGTLGEWLVATEGIALDGGTLVLPALRLRGGDEAWALLTEIADEMAAAHDVRLPARRPVWCSWYYYFFHFTRADLDEVLRGLNSLPDRGGVTTVQIDVGYSTAVGDWLEPNALWPEGLEEAFRAIRAAGFIPGIWVGPFMIGNRSRVALDHPEWLLRHSDGTLVTPMHCHGEQRLWGYRDEEYHVLDTSHPEAFAYIRHVVRTLVRWGADYLKSDFLYWGLHDSATVRRATPGKTSVEYLRELLAMIREELGPNRYWLGCIAPYAATLGYVDGTRIGGDVGPVWSPGSGAVNMVAEATGTQVVNERWFHNDPDAVLIRDFHIGLSPVEVRSLALWQGMLAGNLCTSDPLHRCPPERLALWRFLGSTGTAGPARIVGSGAAPRPFHAACRDLGEGRWAVLVLNPSERPVAEVLPLREATPWSEACVRSWGPEGAGPAARASELVVRLEAHGSALWLVSATTDVAVPATLSG